MDDDLVVNPKWCQRRQNRCAAFRFIFQWEMNPPENLEISDGMYFNTIYPGNQIAMPMPIVDEIVEYEDETPASQDQIIRDVTSFLVWTAEPELEERKVLGIRVLIFLIIITLMLLAVKRKVWKVFRSFTFGNC